jgi:O-antigen ligase
MVFVFIYARIVYLVRYFHPGVLNLNSLFAIPIVVILGIFVVGAFVSPEVFYRSMRGGEETRLGGYLMNPNELGMLAAMGASFSLIEVLARKRLVLHISLLLISIIALAMTTSRSSFIGFFLVAFFIINGSENKRLKFGIYIAMLISVPFVLQYVIFKAGDVEEVLSMTGRLPFWKALINEGIVKEPFWGFGFQRIYYKDHFESVHTYAGHMTHNTFLQVLMNLGFVGFTLMLFQMFFTFLGVGQSKDSQFKIHFMAAIIPLMINSFTEFGIFGQTNYAIFFYQFLLAYLFTGHSRYMSLQDKVNRNIKLERLRMNR